MVEIYGKLMEKTTIGRERKNLQYLTNELFEAAKEDLKTDRKNYPNMSVDEMNNSKGYVTKFDDFINKLEGEIAKHNPERTFKFDKLIKDSLKEQYVDLKKELNKTRVLGVNKNTVGKVKTIAANASRVIGKAVAAAGVTLFALLVAMGEGNGSVGVDGPSGGIDLSKTGEIRSNLKNTLKSSLKDTTVTKTGLWYGTSTKRLLQEKNVRFDKSKGAGGRA